MEPLPHQTLACSPEPWPDAVRHRGFSEASGGFQGVLRVLPALQRGLRIDEYMKVLQDANPGHAKRGTAPSPLLRGELDVCKQEFSTGVFRLSPRGEALLETKDPDVLAEHLLTTMLGPDHVVRALESGPMHLQQMLDFLSKVDPGEVVRNRRLLTWLTDLDVIELDETKMFGLTERGRRWAAMVSWTPEVAT